MKKLILTIVMLLLSFTLLAQNETAVKYTTVILTNTNLNESTEIQENTIIIYNFGGKENRIKITTVGTSIQYDATYIRTDETDGGARYYLYSLKAIGNFKPMFFQVFLDSDYGVRLTDGKGIYFQFL